MIVKNLFIAMNKRTREKLNYVLAKLLIFLYSAIISFLLIFYLIPNIFFTKIADTTFHQIQSDNKQEDLVLHKFTSPVVLKKITLQLNEKIFWINPIQEIRVKFFWEKKEVDQKIFNEDDMPGYPTGFLEDCFNIEKRKPCFFYESKSYGLYNDGNYYLHISAPNKRISHYIVSILRENDINDSISATEDFKVQNLLSTASWFKYAQTNPFLGLFTFVAVCLSCGIYMALQRSVFGKTFYIKQQKSLFEFTLIVFLGVFFVYWYSKITAHIDAYGGLGWDGANYFLMSLMLEEPENIRHTIGANQHYTRFLPSLLVNLIGFEIKESFLYINILSYLITLSLIYFYLKKEGVSFKYILTTVVIFSLMPLSLRYFINYSTLTDSLVNLSVLLLIISIRYNNLLLYSLVLVVAILSKEIFIIFPFFLLFYQLHNKIFKLSFFFIANIIPIAIFIYFLYHPVFYSALRIGGQDNLSDLRNSILPKNLILLFNSYASMFGVMFYIFILQIKKVFGYFRYNLVDSLIFLSIFIIALQFSDRYKIWLLPFFIGFFVYFLINNEINLFGLAVLVIIQILLMGVFQNWSSNSDEYLARESTRMTYEKSVEILKFHVAMIGIYIFGIISSKRPGFH